MSAAPEPAIAEASDLMLSFAERTGLGSDRPPRRYLWTDAFAVCNFLGLARATGRRRFMDLALQLVDQVHDVLGQHRGDDGRRGWLSGLDDEAARAHPTAGGLRIGKELPERRPEEPFDPRLEWDRDGQYFHYLTRWMHALDQLARATHERRFNRWARELAATAHRAFLSVPRAGRACHMSWKMSVDLTTPLVSSMGQHDPLDGLVTYTQLDASAGELGEAQEEPSLRAAIADFSAMSAVQALATDDPLGIGGLLTDAGRMTQLMHRGAFEDREILDRTLEAALEGLDQYAQSGDALQPATHRLAFRELGLVIGLSAVQLAAGAAYGRLHARARTSLAKILQFAELGAGLRTFWAAPKHRPTGAWRAHQDINDVMLATCLAPDGYLVSTAP